MVKKILRRFLILTLFCFTNFLGYSQNFEWLNYTSNNQSEIIKDMVVDINENVIELIQTKPKIQSQTANPFKIRKINSSGVEQWTKILNIQDAVSIDTDSNGNVFLLGCSNGITDLNPDPQIVNSFFSNNSGAGLGNNEALFVLKLDSLGVFQNFATIGEYPYCNGSDGCFIKSYPLQLKIDYNDNVLFTFKPRRGGFIDIDPSSNVQNLANPPAKIFTIIKWSNNLDSLVWVNYMEGQQEEVLYTNTIDVTPKAIFFDIDIDNNVYAATIGFPLVIFYKFSSNGSLLNNPVQTYITCNNRDALVDISVLSNNEIIFGGIFINSIDVNPISSNSSQILNTSYPNSTQNIDAFLVKYDSNFNVIWKQKFSSSGDDRIEDIESYNGKIYVLTTGPRTGVVGSSGVPQWTIKKGSLIILNSDGTTFNETDYISPTPETVVSSSGVIDTFKEPYKWVYYPNSTQNFSLLDWSKRNVAIINQSIFLSGEYSADGSSLYSSIPYFGGFDWDVCNVIPPSHQAGINTIPSNYLIRPYTAKYNLLECSNSSNGIDITILDKNILIYPNPTNRELYFKSDLIIEKIEIYTSLGQLISVKKINGYTGDINTENLSSGFYNLKIYNEHNITSSKFIKY